MQRVFECFAESMKRQKKTPPVDAFAAKAKHKRLQPVASAKKTKA
jgi:hypothetical protein